MPEIGEVARIVSYIHKHLVGKTLSVVKAQHDENVFGKVGTSAAEFERALTGKKVVDARQQGKYFWLVMSTPPHPLCHFGMAGWFKIRNVETAYYKPTKPSSPSEWPPEYWKFTLETLETPKCEAAFVDFRRFARIRLVDCAAEDMRNTMPLKKNGPDPVIDRDILTIDWLSEKLRSKRIPIKVLLLDQANISGIGNWVGDEILYDAKIHPEQYSNSLSDIQIKQLHKSIDYVCSLAVETKSDSSLFPETWLFKHRWQKGKKDSTMKLPNGAKIVFLTVGGRTSAVIPSVQKKTGPVAGDVKDTKKPKDEPEMEEKPKKGTKRAVPKEVEEEGNNHLEADDTRDTKRASRATKKGSRQTAAETPNSAIPVPTDDSKPPKKSNSKVKKRKSTPTTQPPADEVVSDDPSANPTSVKSKRRKTTSKAEKDGVAKDVNGSTKKAQGKQDVSEETVPNGRRRSARVSGMTR